MLQAIPEARVRQMQEAIARQGHRIQYGSGDMDCDVFEILFTSALHINDREDPRGKKCLL